MGCSEIGALRRWCAAAVLALTLAPGVARADILPPPSRPAWDEHPVPLPLPPEAVAAGVLLISGVFVARARRKVGA